MDQFFAQIFCVVAGALKGLRDEEQTGAVVALTLVLACQVTAKHRSTDLINLNIGLPHPHGGFQIPAHKALAHTDQHFFQDVGHGDEVVAVIAQEL